MEWPRVGEVVDEVLAGRPWRRRETPACWFWAPRASGEADPVNALRVWQRWRCAICGQDEPSGRLYADHERRSGLLRGLLCPGCNVHEGLSDHVAYRRYRWWHPTRQLGMTVSWAAPWPSEPPLLPDGTWAMRTSDMSPVELPPLGADS